MNQSELREYLRSLASESGLEDGFLKTEFNVEMVNRVDVLLYAGGSTLSTQPLYNSSIAKPPSMRNYVIADNKRELFAVMSMYVSHNFKHTSSDADVRAAEQHRLETLSYIRRFNTTTQVMELPISMMTGNRIVNDAGTMTNYGKENGYLDLKTPFFMPRESSSRMEFAPVEGFVLEDDGVNTPPFFATGLNPALANNRSYAIYVHCIGYALTDLRKNVVS